MSIKLNLTSSEIQTANILTANTEFPFIFFPPPSFSAQLAINAKYGELGGAAGFLGQAVTGLGTIASSPNGSGYFIHYQGGSIYYSPQTDAHEVHGAIRDKWASMGWEQSFLGFPVTDETSTPDGSGRFNHFQGGSIYWTPSTGAHEVHGAIRDKWASLGFEQSFLGYPVSDETDLGVASGRFSNFQHGQIAWSPRSGTAVSSSSFVQSGNGGVRPQGVESNGKPLIRRRVVASAHMEITDDETFGSNEHGSADNQTEGFIDNTFPRTLLALIGKAGGEVRVELKLDVSATTEGDVHVSGTAKLFEGTSEESDDLDGTTEISFAVPRDGFISQAITVRNTDEGGDFSDIRVVVSNFAA